MTASDTKDSRAGVTGADGFYEFADVTLELQYIVVDGFRRRNGRVRGPRPFVVGR